MSRFISMFAILILVSIASFANADTIISDSFTASNGTTLIGRTPTVNLSGGTYQVQGQGGYETDIQNNHAAVGADIGLGVSIATAGAYTKPTQIQISATINERALGATTDFRRALPIWIFTTARSAPAQTVTCTLRACL